MATINIAEYRSLAQIGTHTGVFPGAPILAVQNHTLATTSTASNTFSAYTNVIEVNADAACFIVFKSEAPITASTTNGTRLISGETRLFGVQPGWLLAAVTP